MSIETPASTSVAPGILSSLVAALCAAATACVVLWLSVANPGDSPWAFSVGAFLGGALLVFGPSRLALTVLFLLALLDHQFRSPWVFSGAGVEWHPREILLLLLFAHGTVKLLQGQFRLPATGIYLWVLLYTAAFAWCAARGLWLGHDARAVIAECRAPLFLGAFWVIAGLVRAPRERFYYGALALCVIVLLAAATVAAFAWFAVTEPIANTQNFLGEFVPRVVLDVSVMSIRPGGHAWFEVALVFAVALVLCPRTPWSGRAVFLGVAALMACAIAAGMMRTALVSVAVSLAVLLWLNLPRIARGLALALVVFIACILGVFVAWGRGAGGPPADYSLNARAVESAGAMAAFTEMPLFGAGFGASFEAPGLAQKDSASSIVTVAYRSLHNSWLYFAWKGGLVGLALALLGLGGLWLHGWRMVERLPGMMDRCVGRALLALFVGQLVASLAMPRITYANGALFIAIWAVAMLLLERASGGGEPARD